MIREEILTPILKRITLFINSLILFTQHIVSSWPAVLLLIIIIFHTEISKVIEIIPSKITQASSIDVNGGTFKMVFEKEMIKSNYFDKYKNLRSISSNAIKTALSGVSNQTAIFLVEDAGRIRVVHIPTDELLIAIGELENIGIIKYKSKNKKITLEQTLHDFLKRNPGYPEKSIYRQHIAWHLATPLDNPSEIPVVDWELTDYGRDFTLTIIDTTSKELSKISRD